MRPEDFFAEQPTAIAVYDEVCSCLAEIGPFEVRTSKSQVAFRRRRGFAYLWLPAQYLRNPQAAVVLSIVLGRHDRSDRFKEVVHPASRHWMHHLELDGPADVDDEVVGWLREASERAA